MTSDIYRFPREMKSEQALVASLRNNIENSCRYFQSTKSLMRTRKDE